MLLAYEILGNPVKRRSYDSVDPQFDDSIPAVTSDSRENFYQVFSPVFEQNSRYQFIVFVCHWSYLCQFLFFDFKVVHKAILDILRWQLHLYLLCELF